MSRASRQAIAIAYAVVCHGCFVVGVAAKVAMMYFGMSLSLGRLEWPWRWIANGALLAQFPLMHSYLLTDRGRGVLARLAPAGLGGDLATTTYVAIASVSVFALFALWSPTGIVWWQAQGPVLLFMSALYATSWLLLGKAMADAGLALQMGTLGWWAVLRGRKPVYPAMPETGLFRHSRQPIYVAFTLTLWTVPTWTPDQLVVAITLTLYCLLGPRFKEARFRRIHGAKFDAYSQRVPYWLPWPRPAGAAYRSTLETKDGE